MVGIISFALTTDLSEGLATLSGNLTDTTIIRQNTRTIQRVGEIASQCTDRIATEPSLISICDSLIQKFNIEFGKFLGLNQIKIEELVYPYTIPPSAHGLKGLTSANVSGSNDRAVVSDHAMIAGQYLPIVAELSYECADRASLYDLKDVESCLSIMESLNSHLRVFNENARPEFERVLNDSPIQTEIIEPVSKEVAFHTDLAGEAEAPPIFSESYGNALIFGNDTSLNYEINVTSLDKVTGAFLYKGNTIENGQPLVTLYNSTEPSALTDGKLVEGTINSSSILVPLSSTPANQLSSLIDLMNQDMTYINIHTADFPEGELRGQLIRSIK